MNILTRLKKLEKGMLNNSTFCVCYPQIRTEVYLADLSEDSESREPVLSGKPVPDVCPNCRKPTEKNQITVQICDASTPERFPKEWNAKL